MYGTLSGANVTFQDIAEASNAPGHPGPLFGTPTVSGNSLLFSPTMFFATAGSSGGVDLSDGHLRFDLIAKPNHWISKFTFSDVGSFSLVGPSPLNGLNATVAVAVPGVLQILEVNNTALITPLKVTPTISYTALMMQADGSGERDLLGLAPNSINAGVPWTANVTYDVAAALKTAGIQGSANKVKFAIDNALAATSSPGAIAYIDKKSVMASVETVPEPATWALLSIAGIGCLWFCRRKQA